MNLTQGLDKALEQVLILLVVASGPGAIVTTAGSITSLSAIELYSVIDIRHRHPGQKLGPLLWLRARIIRDSTTYQLLRS